MSGQASGTPFNHLRMAYPETYKNLCKMLQETGSKTSLNQKPKEEPVSQLTPEEQAKEFERKARDQKQREDDAHGLSMLMKTKRNHFGSWYEGMNTEQKICEEYKRTLNESRAIDEFVKENNRKPFRPIKLRAKDI